MEKYMATKADTANQYWQEDIWSPSYGNVDPQSLGPFSGTHPAITQTWLQEHGNRELVLNPEYQPSSREKKHRLTGCLEKLLGRDLSRRHFKLIK